ncbi:uncharacterized protein LOC100179046 isoform X2 [Ciona intestinalis]
MGVSTADDLVVSITSNASITMKDNARLLTSAANHKPHGISLVGKSITIDAGALVAADGSSENPTRTTVGNHQLLSIEDGTSTDGTFRAGDGGWVKIVAQDNVHIGGNVSANGATDGSFTGRGGSISIKANSISGHGYMNAMGGDASSQTENGGFGGRVEINVDDTLEQFTGSITAYGGCAYSTCNLRSASGIIYISYLSSFGSQITELIFKNALPNLFDTTTPSECPSMQLFYTNLHLKPSLAKNGVISFSKISVLGQARAVLSVADSISSVSIQSSTLVGDQTGQLVVPSNLTLEVKSAADARTDYILQCSLRVEENATVILPSRVRATHTTVQACGVEYDLELRGKLVGVTSLTLGTNATSYVAETASIVVFKNDINVARKISLTSLTLLPFASLSLGVEFSGDRILTSENFNLEIFKFLDLRHGSKLVSSDLKITAPNVTLAYASQILSNGYGSKAGQGFGSPTVNGNYGLRGGSHGGCGGAEKELGRSETSTWCKVYGDMRNTQVAGSGGEVQGNVQCNIASDAMCESKLKYGSGGGVIHIEASFIRLDGVVASNGADGFSSSSYKVAGGSGGSVLIKVDTLRGVGRMETVGGDGVADSVGAGGGGRISIISPQSLLFTGTYAMNGGSSSTEQAGGAGTVYLEDKQAKKGFTVKTKHTVLIVDNRPVSAAHIENDAKATTVSAVGTKPLTIIDETEGNNGVVKMNFNDVYVYSSVHLRMVGTNLTLEVEKLYSEPEALIELQDGQMLILEDNEQNSVLSCSFWLAPAAEMRLPATVSLQGPDNKLSGLIINVFELVVSSGQSVVFSSDGRTGTFIDGEYCVLTEPGKYSFTTLTIKDNAYVKFLSGENTGLDNPMSIGKLEIFYGGRLVGETLAIQGNEVVLHAGSHISVDDGGYKAQRGPGQGLQVNGIGYGAGHAGYGGYNPQYEARASWYGDMANVTQPGSGGGNSTTGSGGSGGGLLSIVMSNQLQIEGSITANGEAGIATNSGGGSGGGVYVKVGRVTGHGLISACGGSGNSRGTGGSGGKVSIQTKESWSYQGSVQLHGGSSNVDSVSGAGGIMVVRDRIGTGYTKIQVTIDARNLADSVKEVAPSVLNGTNPSTYHIDVLHILGNARVTVESSNADVYIQEVEAVSGWIEICNGQRWWLSNDKQTLLVPFNLHIHEDGVANFPNSITLHNSKIEVYGKLFTANMVL